MLMFEVGSRTDSRGTFLCLSKEKYPKEKTPDIRVDPAFLAFIGGCPKGPPYAPTDNAPLPCDAPNGLFPIKTPVLGAADGTEKPSVN